MRRRSFGRGLCLVAMAFGAARGQGPKTSPAISVNDLRLRAGILADDSTRGRETGSIGDDIAARYIASEFGRLGLEPAGDGGTYFQTVGLQVRTPDWTATTLRVGNNLLPVRGDYMPIPSRGVLPWSTTRALKNTESVYGGVFGDALHPIDSASATGRLVVYAVPSAMASRAAALLSGGIPASLASAVGIAFVSLDATPGRYLSGLAQPQMRLKKSSGASEPADMPSLMLISNATFRRIFPPTTDSLRVGTIGARVDGRMAFTVGPTAVPARNVVAILRGTDARRRGTFVSISAHHDHVGVATAAVDHDSLHAYMRVYERFRQASPTLDVTPEQIASIRVNMDSLRRLRPARRDSIFNGADDDVSGTVALLEIAEQFAAKGRPRPKRSILFLSHTGEERGLLGSDWYSTHPTVAIDSIVAEIDMDMVGRGSATDLDGGGDDYLELIGSRRQS
ncbi:MAG TPA: M28 family peptidase, partial [Gemmatimonadaceae bacterium]|nr:M28 family peptidase [Gemmatimonadaceae bacterium]